MFEVGWRGREARVPRPWRWRIRFWPPLRGGGDDLLLQPRHELAICESSSPGQPGERKAWWRCWTATDSPRVEAGTSAGGVPAPKAGAGCGGVAGSAPRLGAGDGSAPGSTPAPPGFGALQADSRRAHAAESGCRFDQTPSEILRSRANNARRGWLQPHRPPDGGGRARPGAAPGTRRLRDEVQHGALSPGMLPGVFRWPRCSMGPAMTRTDTRERPPCRADHVGNTFGGAQTRIMGPSCRSWVVIRRAPPCP